MEKDSECESADSSFRIRFTISNDTNYTGRNKSFGKHCDNPSCRDCEKYGCNIKSTSEPVSVGTNIAEPCNKRKPFKFVQPQIHKSSLIVNLSDTNSQAHENRFVSPDLQQSVSEASSPSASPLSSSYELIELDGELFGELDSTERETLDPTMSQGCNFIGSMVAASRRRSASATPSEPTKAVPEELTNPARRASSSNNLAAKPNSLTSKSTSGNHLCVGMSEETICGNHLTPTNMQDNDGYIRHSDVNMASPLQIDVQELYRGPTTDSQFPKAPSHPISLDDILQIDIDDLRLKDECENLENQVQYWEQKVDDLERKTFSEDVSRTLVENLLMEKKLLRELEFQLYKLRLDSQDTFPLSQRLSPHFSHLSNKGVDFDGTNCKKYTGKFGSHIRPGQENTADILDAVPPSGSLQRRQYLSKASTGTDFSDYSQLPTNGRHIHRLQSPSHQTVSSDDSMGSTRVDQQGNHLVGKDHSIREDCCFKHQHRHYESPIYIQQDYRAHEMLNNYDESFGRRRCSPTRPNHFKSDFKSPSVVLSQDSSSTASSNSPP